MNTAIRKIMLENKSTYNADERNGEHNGNEREACEWKSHGLPFEKFAKILMNGEQFLAYVHKNGYHFTPKLADHVTKMMMNDDGTKHNWTAVDVENFMVQHGWKKNTLNFTWGDAAYLANMAYADFYPEVIDTEHDCLMYAYKMANDEDGYEGIAFARWLSDVVAKEIVVDWEAM